MFNLDPIIITILAIGTIMRGFTLLGLTVMLLAVWLESACVTASAAGPVPHEEKGMQITPFLMFKRFKINNVFAFFTAESKRQIFGGIMGGGGGQTVQTVQMAGVPGQTIIVQDEKKNPNGVLGTLFGALFGG